jgi:hypothetical protein
MNDFLRYLLAPEGMAEGWTAVTERWKWFTHASARRDFDLFRANGIEPRWPDGGIPPDELLDARGREGLAIVCLSVYPKNNGVLLSKGDWLFKMAVHRDDLPRSVGIDCTFGGTYANAAQLRAQRPDLSVGDIFRATVYDREVVITYERVPPEVLRVCPKTAPDAPLSEWPRIVDCNVDDVALFGPPDKIMGYVSV